jgi:hypothetical protein
MEACRVLFGDEARERFDEYFQGKRADDHGRGAE